MQHKSFWQAFFQEERRAIMGFPLMPLAASAIVLIIAGQVPVLLIITSSLIGYSIGLLIVLLFFWLDWGKDHA